MTKSRNLILAVQKVQKYQDQIKVTDIYQKIANKSRLALNPKMISQVADSYIVYCRSNFIKCFKLII